MTVIIMIMFVMSVQTVVQLVSIVMYRHLASFMCRHPPKCIMGMQRCRCVCP